MMCLAFAMVVVPKTTVHQVGGTTFNRTAFKKMIHPFGLTQSRATKCVRIPLLVLSVGNQVAVTVMVVLIARRH
jgi:hypothetical protein